MDDSVYADLLDSLSPVTKAGMDPDQARIDRAGTMAKLLGPDDQPPTQIAQNSVPPRPGTSENGNTLPPGLNSRVEPSTPAPPAVPATVTPTGSPSLADNNAATIGLMQSDYAKASKDVDAEANQPDLATVTKNLEAQRQNQAQPINAYDPKTGKLLDEYKPSFGQRLMRGVEGFARAGVFGVADPKLAGAQPYGAPNAQYGREVHQQGQRVASLDQQLQNAAANYKSTTERLKQVASDRRALATTGKDVTGASIAQQDQPNKAIDAQARATEANNNSPDAKMKVLQNQYTQLQSKAVALGLKGSQRTLFLANGKLPDPKQATGDEIARSQATAAWHRDNPGKQPTLDDIRSINAAVSGSEIKNTKTGKPFPPATAARISDSKNAAMKAAQTKLAAGYDAKSGSKYDKSDFVREMNQAQNTYEEAIEAAGGTVNHMSLGDDLQWKAEQGAEDATGEVEVIHPDGTPGTIPASQLKKALAKGYTQPKKAKS